MSSHKPLQEDELNLSRGENANVLKKTSDGTNADEYNDDDDDNAIKKYDYEEDELNLSRGENANVLKKTSDSVMCWQCNGDKEEYYDHDSS